MRINFSPFSFRPLQAATRELNTSLERLATGKRVNRASDDVAAVPVIENLNHEAISIQKRMAGIDSETAYLGALDGAHSVIGEFVTELNGLVVQAANRGAMTDAEREALQGQADDILKTIDHLGRTTEFRGQQIITQISSQYLGLADLRSGGEQNLVSGDLEKAQHSVEGALHRESTDRAVIGGRVRDLESQQRTLATQLEAVSGVKSTIEDTDYAAETSRMIRAKMLREASLYVQQLAAHSDSSTMLLLLNGLSK